MNNVRVVLLMVVVLLLSVSALFADSGIINRSNDQNMAAIMKAGFVLPKDNGYHQNYTDNSFELSLRYKLSPFVAVEGGSGYAQFHQVVVGNDEKVVVHALPLTASVKGVLPIANVSLYAGGGVGEYLLWGDSGIPDNKVVGRFGVHAGVGGELQLGRREMMLLDYKRTWIDARHEISFDAVSLGFGYRF